MNNDRPIVFTITQYEKFCVDSIFYYDITTKDARGKSENLTEIAANNLYEYLTFISIRLNNKGYAVLFEVD